MPRKLRTFVTNLGFFELAVAAPSMKAALAAWGLAHNAFRHGFAKETDDPKIVAAAEAAPGTVLRRAIGSAGAFKETANVTPSKAAPLPKPSKPAKRQATRKPEAKPPAAVIDLEKSRRAREMKDAKDRERAEAQAERERARKERAVRKAMDSLSAARARHDKVVADIERRRAALDSQDDAENARWEKERHRLEAELFKAKR